MCARHRRASIVYDAELPLKRYDVSVLKQDPDADVAIIEAKALPRQKELKMGNSQKLRTQDPITLLGFPEHSKGDKGIVYRGHVTGRRRHFEQQRILISPPIVAGNSGGPVLDSRNRVVGIAATGVDRSEDTKATLNFGVIPIEVLDVSPVTDRRDTLDAASTQEEGK
jgi:RNA-directed DNA polymerase